MISSVILPVILSVIPKSDKITDRIMDRITDRLMGKKWHNVILCLSLILYLILCIILCIREKLDRIRYGIIHRIINKHDINLPFPRAVLASKHHLITVDFYLWKRWSGWHLHYQYFGLTEFPSSDNHHRLCNGITLKQADIVRAFRTLLPSGSTPKRSIRSVSSVFYAVTLTP